MLHLTENARIILEQRYLRRNSEGNLIETPEKLFHRVAKAVAQAESHFDNRDQTSYWEGRFYELLSSLDFLPNSPTLMSAGLKDGQLSACFVLPIKDNLKSIFSTLKTAALIQQSGGGTGFNFSMLRPEGDRVIRSGGTASGPLSFMKIFDATSGYIKQGGKRRGANMGILNIDHPDVLVFVNAKNGSSALTNFNLSVGITDKFMREVEEGGLWDLINPRTRKRHASIHARTLWNEIVKSAWQTGDPGLIFLDEINRHNPTPEQGRIEATNPCGEVPLLPYEACNLGSIHLLHMLQTDSDKYIVDWHKLAETVQVAIRFLDDVIEVNTYLSPSIKEKVIGNRKIGLGVMGWAEMLIRMGIRYDSEEAVRLGEEIMQFINEQSLKASIRLAEERGVFPNWERSTYYPDTPVRNATRTSIAPTGTISILANTSSSIEPLFALAYERKHILNDETLQEINPLLLDYLQKYHVLKKDDNLSGIEVMDRVEQLPKKVVVLFPTAMNINWEYHIRHQVAFQKYTDNAVSKTINLPEAATIADVEEAYMLAWKLKAKGITIYRNQSKKNQVLNETKKEIPVLLQDGTTQCRVCWV